MHETGHPKLVLGDNQRDRVGRKVGRGFRMGGHMYPCGQFMLIYSKANHNIAK